MDAKLRFHCYNVSGISSSSTITRFRDNQFFFIAGSKIGLYNIATAKIILLPTFPNVNKHDLLYNGNDTYLASSVLCSHTNVKPDGYELEQNIANDHSYEGSRHEVYVLIHELSRTGEFIKSPDEGLQISTKFRMITHNCLNWKKFKFDDSLYQITNLAFSRDCNLLAFTTTIPTEGLLIYGTVSGELMRQVLLTNNIDSDLTNSHILENTLAFSFPNNDRENGKVCVTGENNGFSFWRFNKKFIRAAPVLLNDEHKASTQIGWSCHSWLDDNILIAGCPEGSLMIIHGCDVLFHTSNIFADETIDVNNKPILSTILSRDNIVIAVSFTHSLIIVYQLRKSVPTSNQIVSAKLNLLIKYKLDLSISDDPEYNLQNNTSDKSRIVSLDWRWKSEKTYDEVIVVTNNAIGIVDLHIEDAVMKFILAAPDLLIAESLNINVPKPDEEWHYIKFYQVLGTFHCASSNSSTTHPIESIALSQRTNTLVTLSNADRTLYVRNYLNHNICSTGSSSNTLNSVVPLSYSPSELIRETLFDDSQKYICCDIHPSGTYIVLATESNITEYFTMNNSLSMLRRMEMKGPFYILDTNVKPFYNSPEEEKLAIEGGKNHSVHVNISPITTVKYSHGGQYIGVTTGRAIRIFNVYRMDHSVISNHIKTSDSSESNSSSHSLGKPILVFSTAEHSSNIVDFVFTSDDEYVMTTTADGGVFMWSIATKKQLENYFFLRNFYPLSLATSSDIMDNDISNMKTIVSYQFLESSSYSENEEDKLNEENYKAVQIGGRGLSNRLKHVSMLHSNSTISFRSPKTLNQSPGGTHHPVPSKWTRNCIAIFQGLIHSKPELIYMPCAVTSLAISWIYDASHSQRRQEICILGCEDGRIRISMLPISYRVIATQSVQLYSLRMKSESFDNINSRNISIDTPSTGSAISNSSPRQHHQNIEKPRASGRQISRLMSKRGMIQRDIERDIEANNSHNEFEKSEVFYFDESRCKCIQLHVSAVSMIKTSSNGKFIFTIGMDGFVFILSNDISDVVSSSLLNSIKGSCHDMNNEEDLHNSTSKKKDEDDSVDIGIHENTIVHIDRNYFRDIISRLDVFEHGLDAITNQNDIALLKVKHEMKERLQASSSKLESEIKYRDDIILKCRQDISNIREGFHLEKKQMHGKFSHD